MMPDTAHFQGRSVFPHNRWHHSLAELPINLPIHRAHGLGLAFRKKTARTLFHCGLLLCFSLLGTGCSKHIIELVAIKEQPDSQPSQTPGANGFHWLPLRETILTNTPYQTPDPLLAPTLALQMQSSTGDAAMVGRFGDRDAAAEETKRGAVVFKGDGDLSFRCKFMLLTKPGGRARIMNVGLHTATFAQNSTKSPTGKGYKVQIPLKGGHVALIKEFPEGSFTADNNNIYRLGGEMGGQVAALGTGEHELHIKLQATNHTIVLSAYLDENLLATGIDTPQIDGKHDETGVFTSFDAVSVDIRGDAETALRLTGVALTANEILPSPMDRFATIIRHVLVITTGLIGFLILSWLGWKLTRRKEQPPTLTATS
jgi:hypothetical protein